MIKATAGGGGRGMREVRLGDDVAAILSDAKARHCQLSALAMSMQNG